MNLYELNQNFKNLEDVLENHELTTDLKESIIEEMNKIDLTIQEKADNIIRYIRNLDAEAKAIKEEEKRLADKRRVIENKVKNLESYLFDFVRATEKKEIKGGIFTVGIKKNPAKLIVDDMEAIPTEFIKIETVTTILNKELKDFLKTGQDVKGARLEQGESLKIK